MQLKSLESLTDYRTILFNGDLQITHQHLMPNEYIPEEVHPVDQVLQILSGCAVVRIGERTQSYGPGSLVTVPAGQPHHVRPAEFNHLSLLSFYSGQVHYTGRQRGPTISH